MVFQFFASAVSISTFVYLVFLGFDFFFTYTCDGSSWSGAHR